MFISRLHIQIIELKDRIVPVVSTGHLKNAKFGDSMLYSDQIQSPVGALEVHVSSKGLEQILLPTKNSDNKRFAVEKSDEHPLLTQVRHQLSQYFDGQRKLFDIPLHLEGTKFQIEIWKSLESIEYGTTSTYGELAKRVGRPKAARAVGAANAANPIPIILPCHRVIGANGALTGYGGGTSLLHIKEHLLGLEAANTNCQ